MSAVIQRLPSGRHIISLLGDPGPLPGEEEVGQEESADLLLSLKAFWAEQVALIGARTKHAPTLDQLEALALALLIAIDQWRSVHDRCA